MSMSSLSDSLSALQQIFSKSDTNKSGGLSKSEFAAAAQQVGLGSSSGTTPDALFKQMDSNGDGELSESELSQGVKLAEKIHDALLMAQELMSGSTLMNMLGGKSGDSSNSIASLFTSDNNSSGTSTDLASLLGTNTGNSTDDTSSNDAYTALLQSLIAKYNDTETATQEASTSTTTTTVSA